jgi:hypothetical protein
LEERGEVREGGERGNGAGRRDGDDGRRDAVPKEFTNPRVNYPALEKMKDGRRIMNRRIHGLI